MAKLTYILDGAQSSKRRCFGNHRHYHCLLTMAQGKRFDVALRRVCHRKNILAG